MVDGFNQGRGHWIRRCVKFLFKSAFFDSIREFMVVMLQGQVLLQSGVFVATATGSH